MPTSFRNSTYVIIFQFLDPIRIAMSVRADEAIVRVVAGLVRGSSTTLSGLSPRAQVNLVNCNLIELASTMQARRRLEKAAIEPGAIMGSYCSRCGRKFVQNRCKTCKIEFRLRSPSDNVIGTFPPVPPRVFRYLLDSHYKFQKRLPRF